MTDKKMIIAEVQKDIAALTADIETLEKTLKFLRLNPHYDDGSNKRELYRQYDKLTNLIELENELQFLLFIKSKNNMNGTRNFLAVDAVNKIYCFSTTAATSVSYSRIRHQVKVSTDKQLKLEAEKLEAAGYVKVDEDAFTEVKEGGR